MIQGEGRAAADGPPQIRGEGTHGMNVVLRGLRKEVSNLQPKPAAACLHSEHSPCSKLEAFINMYYHHLTRLTRAHLPYKALSKEYDLH